MAASLQAGRRAGPAWTAALPPLHAPTQDSPPSLPPTFPSSPIPTDPGFLTWSRLGLQLPDVLPTPPPPSAPTGHGPRPASPAWSACAPPWRTWVSRARVPLCPALHQPLDPLPHPGAPGPPRHLLILPPVFSQLSARASFPTPRPPSCLSLPALPGPAAPSLLSSPGPFTLSCGRAREMRACPWAPAGAQGL